MRKFALAALAAVTAVAAVSPVAAATVTTNLGVRIVIQNACTVATPGDLDFGTQGVLAANIDNTATLNVTCTSGAAYNIGLGVGAGSGATVTTRKMTNGAATVNYTMWRDAGRTQNWGNTVGTDTLASTGTGTAQAHTIYGRVPPQTTPAAGTYTDTVVVTVTY